MSIINLRNNHFNNESTRLSPHKIFAYKNLNFTDSTNLFYEKLISSNLNEIQKTYLNSTEIDYLYGLQQPDAFQQSSNSSAIREINGTSRKKSLLTSTSTQINATDITKKILLVNSGTYSNVFDISKIDLGSVPDDTKNLEIESRYFGVKRLVNEFRPLSNVIEKKKIIKNLYKNEKVLNDSKYQQSFNYGFYNYNSLNFFNIESSNLIKNDVENLNSNLKEKLNNNTHQCCLIYSNKKINNKNIFPGINSALTINFWINPRRLPHKDYYYNPGCIINIPNIISIYLMEDETKRENNESYFYIRTKLQNDSNDLTPRIITNKTFSTDPILNHNQWYNVTASFDSNTFSININNNNLNYSKSFKLQDFLEFEKNEEDFGQSIFTIGNQLNLQSLSYKYDWYNQNNPRKYFFNENTFSRQSLNSKEILITNTDLTIENLFFSSKIKLNSNSFNEESFALNAELQGLIILNSNVINNETLKDFYTGKNNLLLNEKYINNVLFYLPCCYLSVETSRESYITFGQIERVKYNSYINPYFSNMVTGNEVSVENFVIDFISDRRPYISGMSPVLHRNSFLSKQILNTFSNIIKTKRQNIIKNVVKYHKNPNQIYNSVFTDILPFIDTISFNIDNFLKNNLIYRNNFILPCDNGLNNLNLNEEINKKYNNNSSMKLITSQYFNKNFMYINSENVFLTAMTEYASKDQYNKNSKLFLNNDQLKSFLFKDISLGGLLLKNNSYGSVTNLNIETYFSTVFLNKSHNYNINNNIYNLTNDLNYNDFYLKIKDENVINKKYLINSIFKNFDGYSNDNKILVNESYTLEKSVDNQQQNFNFNKSITKFDVLSNYNIEGELLDTNSVIFDISNRLYSSRIRKENIKIVDYDISGTGGTCSISLKDDGKGLMYRADCLTPHATWNYVGHVFYRDGLVILHHPGLSSFGENNFLFELKGDHKLFTQEINVPIEKGDLNRSNNKTYKKLRPSTGLYDIDEENFVYITGVNLHDENLNIVARANFAQPIVKRQNDRYNIRLKMDY